ncbi:low molecular weight phosphotyrosine protein phosphatase [Nocardioides sp. JQ2195]|uniref:low molecular weight protein-tyrosine-phosphatase n=1 Tax=Nocardioides sp. JQ2195 TaxID=2592334 RepID=UPI00143E4F0B|nr:low molecular weight protein-tyrosine-phosphatase [Nocardioides sp. JQ2195]QIX25294.1 low molecular weight phosphotyrosine protein phosphatase [Nocardioides sp. JQ2195]
MSLPPPRTAGAYRIALVCLGNICRSPIADVVVNHRLHEAGLDALVSADSYGTAGWHIGNPMDPRSAATLDAVGHDSSSHRARQIDAASAATYDLVVAMDHDNARDLRALGVPDDRLRLFRDFDPTPGDGDVPDPYYGGDDGFSAVLELVERSADGLIAALEQEVVRT